MSAAARDWAWSRAVPPAHKLVLLALAEHADPVGQCWPSIARLTADTGLARSTVVTALNALEEVRAGGAGTGWPAALDPLPAADRGGGPGIGPQ